MKRESPWGQQVPGHSSKPAGEGIGLSRLRRKDGTNKVSTIGVDRDNHGVEGVEREANRREKMRHKRSRVILGNRSRSARQRS